MYTSYFQQLIDVYFNDNIMQYAQQLNQQVISFAYNDVWHRIDFAWNTTEINNSINETILIDPNTWVLSIQKFLELRRSSAQENINNSTNY